MLLWGRVAARGACGGGGSGASGGGLATLASNFVVLV